MARKKWLLTLAVLAIVSLAVLSGIMERPEMSVYDSWFRIDGVKDPGEQVVIIGLDDKSYEKLGPPAWPRSVHAKMLEKLQDAGAVTFDLTFDSVSDPAEDTAFAEAISRHGRVVLGVKFSYEEDQDGEVVQVLNPPAGDINKAEAGWGFVNMPTELDDVVRRSVLVDVNTYDVPFPSLALASVLRAENADIQKIEVANNVLQLGERSVALDSLNMARPGFWGPQGTFKTYSYVDVLDGKVPPEAFKDKIVLIGSTSVSDRDYDSTPYTTSNLILSGSLPTPGVEIHASIIQSFLEGRWYTRVSGLVNFAFLIIVGLLAVAAVSGRGPWLGLAGTLGVAAVSMGLVFALWKYANWWLNLAAPLVLIFLMYAVMTAADFVQAELGRRRTRSMLRRYVSPDVAEQLMKDPEAVKLGGQRQEITIMFADIRGFTAYSEKKEPEEVVARLNEYLSVMTKVIFANGGTLDKYLGDGLMAIFGAPAHLPDHADRAVKAAVEIQAEIEKLNRTWTENGHLPLMIGVGINSGPALVGNVGSNERMDYTVIGEDVNLASRVESLTKTFNNLICVSERTLKYLGDETKGKMQYMGHAEVKGFTDPVGVHTVLR